MNESHSALLYKGLDSTGKWPFKLLSIPELLVSEVVPRTNDVRKRRNGDQRLAKSLRRFRAHSLSKISSRKKVRVSKPSGKRNEKEFKHFRVFECVNIT